jgi:hypothetical protein
VRGWLAALMCLMLAPQAWAQVGHLPGNSPYEDLEYRQEWSWFVGYFDARKDPVGVAPQGGMLLGTRWDVRLAGPAYFTGRLAGASLSRRIIDPTKPIGQRFVGEENVPVALIDAGFSVNLTGFRSWHSLVPVVSGGFGTVTDVRGKNDIADYRFGMPLTFTFGAGIKWVPLDSKWQVRLDWSNYEYRIHYPGSYYLKTGTDDPVRLPDQPHSLWRRNVSYQLGISYLFRR